MRLADSFARASAGRSMLARIAMMAMTTSSSIRVNALFRSFIIVNLSKLFPASKRQSFARMTRKQWMFVALAVLLGGLSLYLNRDWFAADPIQISHRSLPPRPGFWGRRRPDDAAVNPVLFLFNRHVKL